MAGFYVGYNTWGSYWGNHGNLWGLVLGWHWGDWILRRNTQKLLLKWELISQIHSLTIWQLWSKHRSSLLRLG